MSGSGAAGSSSNSNNTTTTATTAPPPSTTPSNSQQQQQQHARVYEHRPLASSNTDHYNSTLGSHYHPHSSHHPHPQHYSNGSAPMPGPASSSSSAAAAGLGGGPPLGYQPPSLPPPQPPMQPGAVVVGGGGPHPSAARFNDLLEFVKAEFDQVAGESGGLKLQRDEYEAMINHHANELNAMRAMSYDLERKHHEDKRAMQEENSRLQDEVVHLRHQLASVAAGGSSAAPQNAPLLPPPALNSNGSRPTLPPIIGGPRPSSTTGGPLFAGDPSAADRGSPYSAHDSSHPSKRLRTGAEDIKPPPSSSSSSAHAGKSPYPPPPPPAPAPLSQAGSRPSSVGPGPAQAPLRHTQASPLPSTGPARRDTASPAVSVSHSAAGAAGGDAKDAAAAAADAPFDPETVTRDLKKEGSDWMTMFNPNVKRVLDVGLVHTLVHDSVVCCVRFSPDGKVLATGCNRNTTLYDTKTGAKITVLSDDTSSGVKQDNYIRSASFSPDGKLLATGSEDRIVRIWNIAQKRIAKIFQGHKSEIYSLAFSPDGRRLVSGSGDKTARVWDMDTGTCVHTLAIEDVTIAENGPVDAGVTSVVISPDGALLAAGSLDTVVRIWDTHTGQLLDKLKGHKDSVYSVAFAPDGKFLVSGSLDKTLKMWDMASLKRSLAGEGSTASTSADRDSPASASEAGGSKTTCLTTLQGHKDYVLSVDISPDGAWIVSGSKDRGVQFWDPRSAKAQFMLQGHKNSVISVAVSDVGGLVATGSGDWSARIWHYEHC